MSRARTGWSAAVTLASAVLLAPLGAQERGATVTLAIEHVTVIPMTRDTALTDHTVLVGGDRVVWVGPSRSARVPAGARRIDGRGAFLLPGLADMHVHLEQEADLAAYVNAGVTTVRNMRGGPQHVAWRDSIAAGRKLGPTVLTAGPTCCRGPLPKREFIRVRTPEEGAAAVREIHGAGYDMIKMHSRLPADAFTAMARVARELRMPLVGHYMPDVGLSAQLSAGQSSVEHLGDLFVDPARADELLGAIAASRAWVGTILQSYDGQCGPATAAQRAMIAAARRKGVQLLAATDASLGSLRAGTAVVCELRTLVGAGLTPYEALATATRNAGEFVRAARPESVVFGVVAPGARADLVLLASDPRADLAALSRVRGIVLRGAWRAPTH